MRKVNNIFASDAIQYFTGGLVKYAPAAIMMRLEPHSLKKSPDRLRNVEMRRISGKIKDIETSFPPLCHSLCNLSFAVNGGIVKYNKSHFVDSPGKIVKPLREYYSSNGICGVEPMILTVRGYHSEYVEPLLVFGWNEHIFIVKLPTIRDITTGAYMALISKIEIDDPCTPKICKFLQLIAFELNKLRRGCFPWTFPYTFISCASKSKKRLNVASLTSFCEFFCQAALAVLILSRCSLTAALTAGVSALLINGAGPREPFSRRPSMPFFSKRFTQLYTAIFPYPTIAEISSPFMPSALSKTPWQRMRNLWQEPYFKPFSNSLRCSVVRFNFFVFPIVCLSYFDSRNITSVDEQIVYH